MSALVNQETAGEAKWTLRKSLRIGDTGRFDVLGVLSHVVIAVDVAAIIATGGEIDTC